MVAVVVQAHHDASSVGVIGDLSSTDAGGGVDGDARALEIPAVQCVRAVLGEDKRDQVHVDAAFEHGKVGAAHRATLVEGLGSNGMGPSTSRRLRHAGDVQGVAAG